jgi:hypothetical protein
MGCRVCIRGLSNPGLTLKIIMMKKTLYFLIFVLALGLTSCEKLHDWNQQDDPAIEYSPVWPLSGEWWVVYRFDDGSGVIDDYTGAGHVPLFTYNTASNSATEFWISDGGNLGSGESSFWSYCVKCPCNVDNTSYAIWVNVSNGRVIEDGGVSPSGIVSDSIYLEVEFEDAPGTIFQVSGIRKTGFLEDEY